MHVQHFPGPLSGTDLSLLPGSGVWRAVQARSCPREHRQRGAELKKPCGGSWRCAGRSGRGDRDTSTNGHRTGTALDEFSVEELNKRVQTVVTVAADLQNALSRLFLHVLDLLSCHSARHCPHGGATPRTLLRFLTLFYLLPARNNAVGGRTSHRDKFLAVKKIKISELYFLVKYAHVAAARRQGTTEAPTENTAFKPTSAACRRKNGVCTAARGLLAEKRAPAMEGTFYRVIKFG